MTAAVIAVANQKGGVGKTATAVNIAHGAALRGFRVLLVDLDSQGNVADSLGMDEGNELRAWLNGGVPQINQARENLWVIRSNKDTANFKNELASRDYREMVISEALADLLSAVPYDLVVMDCAPSIDVLHVAALTAADYLIVPTRLDQFAAKGVLEILRTLSAVNRRGGRCHLAGILPTFYDRQTLETQTQLESLVQAFGGQVWPLIPMDSKIRSANRAGKTLWEFSPSTRAIKGIDGVGGGYLSVLDRLLSLL